MSNPVVTAAIYDPAITDPSVTNIVVLTQGRLNNLLARGQPYLLIDPAGLPPDENLFTLQDTHRVAGEPPVLTLLAG